jgi:hypothetical protein
MTDEPNNHAARLMKRVCEMTVEDILRLDTYVMVSALKKGEGGIYANEVYNGRSVRVEKTDTAYLIRLSNPDTEFSTDDCVDAVEIIKRELGYLLG